MASGSASGDLRVQIVDVSPRDGLQNEPVRLATETKVAMIERLLDAGTKTVEVASFVSPKAVPALADAEEVVARVRRRGDGVRFVALVVNRRGVERAARAQVKEINAVVVCSDALGRHNQGMTVEEALASWSVAAEAARAAGIVPSVTLAGAFGCPYEGEVPPERVRRIANRVADSGPARITVADTIGVASPADVEERVDAVRSAIDTDIEVGCHFHNTRNTGVANVYAAFRAGVRSFDTSLGGIGGCPFAPTATGNVPTEDVAYMFDRMGVATGLDLDKLIDAVGWLEAQLGHSVPGLLARAGAFPSRAAAQLVGADRE